MKYIIYGLIDPTTKELRYIGQSSTGFKRPKSHMYKSVYKRYNSHLYCWIRGLVSKNLSPEIVVIEELLCRKNLSNSEQFYISYFKAMGCRLTNLTVGGEVGSLGIKQSPETIAKRTKNCKSNYKWTVEDKKRLSRSKLGISTGPRSEYTKLKISLANRGANNGMYGKSALNRRVIIDQNGTIYPSLRIAAQKLALQESNISKVLYGHRKHTGGFRFSYLEVSVGS